MSFTILKFRNHSTWPIIQFLAILGLTYGGLWVVYELIFLSYYSLENGFSTDPISQFVAWLSAQFLILLGYDASILTFIDRFGSEVALGGVGQVIVVPGCSGAKNLFVLIGLLVAFPGSIKTKVFYIPISILVLIVFNSLRVSGLALIQDGSLSNYFNWIKPIFGYLNHIALFLIFVGWLQLSSKKH